MPNATANDIEHRTDLVAAINALREQSVAAIAALQSQSTIGQAQLSKQIAEVSVDVREVSSKIGETAKHLAVVEERLSTRGKEIESLQTENKLLNIVVRDLQSQVDRWRGWSAAVGAALAALEVVALLWKH